MVKGIRVNLDEELVNSDWTKRTFDLDDDTPFDPKNPAIMNAVRLPKKLKAAKIKYLQEQRKNKPKP